MGLKIAKVTPVFKDVNNTKNSNSVDQYLYYLVSPKYLSALCTIGCVNAYSIQTFSKKNNLASRKDTQPTMQFYNL